jgi:glycosyltransferase involved in cell wall biosynthesis
MRVSVVILCYNLQDYIARAIASVLMQQTSFNFEVIVLNDGSTDDSLQIIEAFKDRIILINHKTNHGLIKSRIEAYDKCQGKYIALCDGDDYWTDELKLQKQVEFMESHPDFGLVHTGFEVMDETKNEFIHVIRARHMVGGVFESLMFNNKISSCTVLFRKKYWDEIDKVEFEKLNASEDRFIWMHIAKKSLVHFIVDSTAIYTKREGSMSGYKDNKKQSKICEESFDIRYYYIDKYGCSEKIQRLLYEKAIKIAESINNPSMGDKAIERLKKVI